MRQQQRPLGVHDAKSTSDPLLSKVRKAPRAKNDVTEAEMLIKVSRLLFPRQLTSATQSIAHRGLNRIETAAVAGDFLTAHERVTRGRETVPSRLLRVAGGGRKKKDTVCAIICTGRENRRIM